MPRDLTKLARGEHCYVGAPECTHDSARVVLCHIRRGHVGGMGLKPAHLLALPGCDICNAIMDGDYKSVWTRDQVDSAILSGYMQWLNKLLKNEVVIICL